MERYLLKYFSSQSNRRTNLFLLGEQKCGTTSLFYLLKNHPKILTPGFKECHYFNTIKVEHDQQYENYHRLFKHSIFKRFTYQLDASPDYLGDEKSVALIYEYNPDAKFIVILRNPVDRFISAYLFYFSIIVDKLEHHYQSYFQFSEKGKAQYLFLKNNPHLGFSSFLEAELSGRSPIGALQRGFYFEHIARWEKKFGTENICILFLEHLTDPQLKGKEIQHLEKFLSLKLGSNFPHVLATSQKKPVSADDFQILQSYYTDVLRKYDRWLERPLEDGLHHDKALPALNKKQ